MKTATGLRLLASVLALAAFVGLAFGLAAGDWFFFAWVGYPAVGWYLVLRRPTHRMGWILLLGGLCWGGTAGLIPIAEATASVWVEILSSQLAILGFTMMALVPIVFPSGLASGTGGRWMAGGLIGIATLTVLSELVGSDAKPSGQVSPIAVPALRESAAFLQNQGFFVIPLLLAVAIVHLVARWRASTGVEYHQYRWFLTALAVVTVTLAGSAALDTLPPAVGVVSTASLNLLPVAIGIAVLRFRLYEIDTIISRTVTYVLVALVIGAAYVIPVVTASRLLGESSDLVVAGSTLGAAAVFYPARRGLQRAVDRRFNRARFDAEREVDGLTDRLRSITTVGAISDDVTEVVARTVQPGVVTLWIRGR